MAHKHRLERSGGAVVWFITVYGCIGVFFLQPSREGPAAERVLVVWCVRRWPVRNAPNTPRTAARTLHTPPPRF